MSDEERAPSPDPLSALFDVCRDVDDEKSGFKGYESYIKVRERSHEDISRILKDPEFTFLPYVEKCPDVGRHAKLLPDKVRAPATAAYKAAFARGRTSLAMQVQALQKFDQAVALQPNYTDPSANDGKYFNNQARNDSTVALRSAMLKGIVLASDNLAQVKAEFRKLLFKSARGYAQNQTSSLVDAEVRASWEAELKEEKEIAAMQRRSSDRTNPRGRRRRSGRNRSGRSRRAGPAQGAANQGGAEAKVQQQPAAGSGARARSSSSRPSSRGGRR